MKKLQSLKKELTELKAERDAVQAQSKLLENFVTLARSSSEIELMRAMLRKTLEISTELADAEKGSLFLLDRNGIVTDSILTREESTPLESSQVIGSVLDKGLAGWVRKHRQVGLVDDTHHDERWLTLPLEPYTVRSALAVPILKGANLFGILTLLHSEPGQFNPEIAENMQTIANQIGLALENVQLYQELERAKKAADDYSRALDEELIKGRQIQKDFLPSQIPRLPEWKTATCFLPATQVSGDFYDVFALPNNCWGIVIADVCDKGVGAALFMAMFRSLIRIFSGHTESNRAFTAQNESKTANRIIPSEKKEFGSEGALKAISLTNEYIEKNHSRMGMFATIFFGVLNTETGWLSYINAGHEPPIVLGSNGIKYHLEPTGPAVGLTLDATFLIQYVNLDPGDILIGYTDGVTEACNSDGELFSKKRLHSIVENPAATVLSVVELVDRIKSNLLGFVDTTPQSDDITILSVQRKK
jgi:sigma-B regulation protein RsbU (phosphoserine phosphatase)